MQSRNLGRRTLKVSVSGLTCMGMGSGNGPAADRMGLVALIRAAVERRV